MSAPSEPETPNYRLLFESAPGLYLVLKPDAPRYSIVAVSDAYARATMTQRDAILGRGLFEVFPDDPADPTADGVRKLGESLGRVLARRTADAMADQRYAIRRPPEEGGGFEERWWRPTNTPVFDARGETAYIIHRVEDVTALVRIEQSRAQERREHAELQVRVNKLEAELRAIIRQSPVSIAMFDCSMRYLAVSDRWVRDYCPGTPDLVGRNHYDVFPDLPARWREAHRRAFAGEALEVPEDLWVHADGRKQWVHWAVLPWYDETGAIGGLIISGEDITERKQAADALKESEQRYSAIFATSPFAIALTRLPEERFVAVNDSYLRLFDRTREELIGRRSAELPVIDAATQARALADLQVSGSVRELECVHTTKSGAQRSLLLDIDLVRIGGQPHTLTTIRDITAQRTAEDKAILYEKARLLDEAKTQFFAGISHELRTPLALILGPTEQLLAAAELEPTVRHDLEVIDRNARTLLHHVNDLLDIAKLEAAQMKVEYVETDVSRLTRFMASHFESLADEKALTYTLEIADGVSAQVDADKLRRILLNLLSNAFKFTPSRGRVRLSLRAQDGQLQIEVADSGPGIPPEQHQQVFERFQQLDQGATRRFGGTGLGLAIARDFVFLHGGNISIAKAPEGGALFLVRLPQTAPAGSAVRKAERELLGTEEAGQVIAALRSESGPRAYAGTGGSAGLVLVVEDNLEMNRFICESLSSEYRVLTASNGTDGLRVAIEMQPDVIVTDMMMPEMSGEALVRAVRIHPKLERTPVMFLTAKSDATLRVRALREGAQDFLTKPFSVEELRARVSNLVIGKKALEIESRLAALIEQAPDGIFVSDETGRFVEVNEAACRMLGYRPEELIGKTRLELVASRDHERLAQVLEQMRRGETVVAEWLLRKRDGTEIPVEASSKFLRDGRSQSYVRDISERRRLEQALRFSEARASGILAISADAIICIDEQHRITLFNDGAVKIFGFERSEALGAPLDIVVPERLRAVHAQHIERFIAAQETARHLESRQAAIIGLRKNGEEFPADAAISQLDVGGKKLLTVTLRDVSEQRRIEREQRFLAEVGPVLAASLEYEETLSRLAQLVVRELAELCIIDIVDESSQLRRDKILGRYPSLTGVGAELLKLPRDGSPPPLIGSVVESQRTLLLPRLTPEQVAAWGRGLQPGPALQSVTPQSLLAVPLLVHGKLLGVVTLLSLDASRHYRPEDVALVEQLAYHAALSIENARLYRASGRAIKSRDDVLGIVAHDLRNPLNAILLQLRLLLKRREDPTGRWQEPADMIRASVARMNRLIQDLLDVARLEAGALAVTRSRLSTRQLLWEALDSQHELATGASIELGIEGSETLPEITADRGRLLQVFENLLGNAIKFSKAGSRVVVGGEVRDDEVLFWVRDTGAGIPPEQLPHLFDRFWQAERADRRGVGLGLSIVQGIIAMHGGRIWVESTLGQGSTFYFTIPLRK